MNKYSHNNHYNISSTTIDEDLDLNLIQIPLRALNLVEKKPKSRIIDHIKKLSNRINGYDTTINNFTNRIENVHDQIIKLENNLNEDNANFEKKLLELEKQILLAKEIRL
ncbi:hypothetical protein M0813_27958 [Anaeramoeba flamelloides]|uniref:Uncharacterized protein n=1 Tax=Anaeramoeba flamelloides TaxID=1746091 RepID=A0ABQ8XWY2_9EUKA|nr:hypothetical protein M0813_27958 [Anaeramoeba flamelloides]